MIRFIATVAYSGYLRPASGTWGSLAAVLLGGLVWWLLGPVWLVVLTILAAAAGVWATAEMIRDAADHDPSEIVIDELAGQWIALWPLAFAYAGWPPLWQVGLAFLLFRLFDVLKPGPIGWADRRGDALGVMLDDLLAGLAAGLIMAGLIWIT